jgi:ribosomal protein L32
VRGHQDRQANYYNLSHEEQLNVEADHEATAALQHHSRNGKYSNMPTTGSMLYHNGRPVTSKEADTLRKAYGQIAYAKHVNTKEHWAPATYATVWWEVQKQLLSKLEDNDRTRITKFVNRILPSNWKLDQQDKQHSSKCPSCNEIKTNHHISACSNPRWAKLRNNMLKTVRKAMEKNETHIHAQEIILHGIKAAVNHGIEIVAEEDLSFQPNGIIKLALKEQNAIGWTNFYKGCISKKWEQVQHQHYKRAMPKKTDTHRWATAIISSMWQGLLLMWEDRNNDQHGRDSIKQIGKEREKLLQKINQLYTQKERIDPEDRRLYHKPVEKWKEERNKKIREWIHLAESLTKNTKKNRESEKWTQDNP